MDSILGSYNYWVAIILMMTGLYIVIASSNLVKKLMGLGIFQTSVLLIYISVGFVRGARAPILESGAWHYVNPLPHVLMLTAIVVGVATLAVGLALAARIREAYGTVEEDDILKEDRKTTARRLTRSERLTAEAETPRGEDAA